MKKSPLLGWRGTPPRDLFFVARGNEHVSHRTYYVKEAERRDLIREVGESGMLLYEYYLSLVNKGDGKEITDETSADYFGWSKTKAQKKRNDLITSGWFRSESFTYSGGRKGTTYYIGKFEVEKSFMGSTSSFPVPVI